MLGKERERSRERPERDGAREIDPNPVLWIHFGTGDKRINWKRMRGGHDRVTLPWLKGVKVDALHSAIFRRDHH